MHHHNNNLKEPTVNYIVTHPGPAHRDELLAIAVLLAHYGNPVPVYRREPSEEELLNKSVAVIDCGGVHDPELSNFDHHQYEGGDCSLHLVMKHIGYHDYAAELFPWYAVTNDFDVRGPLEALKSLDVSQGAVAALRSPVEVCLLRLCGRMVEVDAWLLEILMQLGRDILGKANAMRNRFSKLDRTASIVTVNGVKGIISTIEPDPSFALSVYRTHICPDAAFSICPDDRGPGHVLYRFDDNKRFDLSVLANDSRIAFAHKGGFVAKTKVREPVERLLNMISKSIVVRQLSAGEEF
jgi:hypothetical protein